MKRAGCVGWNRTSGLGLVAAVVVSAATASAQTAQVTGRITDASSAVLSGAVVIVTNTDTSASRRTASNDDGYYVVPFLPPGVYSITVQFAGFTPAQREKVTLSVDQVARIDFVLELQGFREAIEVDASAPLLPRDTSSLGHVIENKAIVTLPLNGRTYSQLALLVPGAAPNPLSRATDAFTLNGQRSFQNNFLIDGVDNNNHIFGAGTGSTQAIQPSLEAVQEFRIDTASYSAEYGRAAGGVISVAIKSGTNTLHGSGFEFFRHDVLEANDFFANREGLSAPPLRYHQFGATVGGPIVRNRTFFFTSYQGTRERRTYTATVTVPTPDMIEGRFGTISIYDPLTVVNEVRQPFPNNTILPDRIDPVGQRIARLYPAPNRSGLVGNFVGPVRRTEHRDQIDIRFDHRVGDQDQVFVRYSRWSGETTQGSLFGPPGNGYPNLSALPELQQSPLVSTPRGTSLVIGETHVFSNAAVNELRLGYLVGSSQQRNPADTPLFEEFGIKGISPVPGLNGLPVFNVSGFGLLGDRRALPNDHKVTSVHLSNSVSWVRGRHALRFGGEARLKRTYASSALLARGEFVFNGQFTSQGVGTGSALADLLLGQTSNAILNSLLHGDFRDRYFAAYVQDSWRPSPRVTLNLGLRYEIQTALWERHNRMSNFDADPGSPTLGRLLEARDGNFESRAFSRLDVNNIAPRLGLVYQLDPHTIVRGSFGVFYGGLGYQAQNIAGVANLPHYVRVAFPSDSTASVSALVLANGFPLGALNPQNARNPEAIILPKEFTLPHVRQWSVGGQRALPGATEVSLTYVGSETSHLRGLNDINAPVPGPGPPNPRRPFRGFGRILSFSDFVNASYHGLQAKVERRFVDGLAVVWSYTLSHAIDTGIDPGDVPVVISAVPQNPNNPRAEKASADFDVRHRLVTSTIYDLPDPRNGLADRSRVARALLSGWQVAAIFVAQSGLPMTPTLAENRANTTTPQRPDCVGDGNLPRDRRSVDRWFDPMAFRVPARFTYGNCGRNILRAPGLVNLDLLIARNIAIRAGKRLELRAEIFNLANAVHLGRPNLVIDVPDQAGRIASTQAPPRQVQLGARFVF